MSCDRLCFALVCLAAVLSHVPSVKGIPSELLSTMTDKSICQSVVEYDEDPNRIPRLIKEVKCIASPDKMCPARDGSDGQVSCCKQNSYRSFQFGCEEVIDTVLVSDTEGNTSQNTVSVGCACVMKESIQPIEV